MKKVELLEAKQDKDSISIKGKIDKDITTINGRNRVIRNGKVVRIDIKPIIYANKQMFKVTEYTR